MNVCSKFREIASWLSLCYLSPSPAAPLCAAPPDARSRSSPSSRPLFYLFERLDTASRAAHENTDVEEEYLMDKERYVSLPRQTLLPSH